MGQIADMVVGAYVRHIDGRSGTVTFVHDGDPGKRIIEWKSCGHRYISGEEVLRVELRVNLRWRKYPKGD